MRSDPMDPSRGIVWWTIGSLLFAALIVYLVTT